MKKRPYNYSSKDRSKKNIKNRSSNMGKSYNYYANKSYGNGKNNDLRSYDSGNRNYSNIGNRSYKYNKQYDNTKSYNNSGSVEHFNDNNSYVNKKETNVNENVVISNDVTLKNELSRDSSFGLSVNESINENVSLGTDSNDEDNLSSDVEVSYSLDEVGEEIDINNEDGNISSEDVDSDDGNNFSTGVEDSYALDEVVEEVDSNNNCNISSNDVDSNDDLFSDRIENEFLPTDDEYEIDDYEDYNELDFYDDKNTSENNLESDKKTTLIENTNTIKLDDSRLNDASSLDTSFLEGRIERKVNKNKKVKERILKDNSDLLDRVIVIRKMFTYAAFALAILLVVVFVFSNYGDVVQNIFASSNKEEEAKVVHKKQSNVIDRNYLFVGDHHSENFDFKEFDLDYHYVKSGKEDLTADEIYRNIKQMIYSYNPSIVFIEVGFHDIEYGHGDESFISYLTRVINGIKSNRSSSLIYVQSIYPIDEDSDDVEFSHATNERIVELNKKIKNLTKELDVEYLDVYDMLCEDDKLNPDYSDDGLNLNKEGYKQVLKVIKKVVG